MTFRCVIFVALAVYGVFANSILNSGFQSNGYSILNGGYGSTLPVINTHIRTPVVENPAVQLPGFPSSVTDTCHCFKTVVRPQLCNEIISVPTIDRLVRTVSSNPVVETVHFNANEVPRFTQSAANVLSGGERQLTGAYQTNVVRSANIYNSPNAGTFSTYQATNGNVFNKHSTSALTTYSRANTGLLSTRPSTNTVATTSGTFQNPAIYQNNYSNTPTITAY